jgi:hypothetical protein
MNSVLTVLKPNGMLIVEKKGLLDCRKERNND